MIIRSCDKYNYIVFFLSKDSFCNIFFFAYNIIGCLLLTLVKTDFCNKLIFGKPICKKMQKSFCKNRIFQNSLLYSFYKTVLTQIWFLQNSLLQNMQEQVCAKISFCKTHYCKTYNCKRMQKNGFLQWSHFYKTYHCIFFCKNRFLQESNPCKIH